MQAAVNMITKVALLLLLVCSDVARAQPRWIEGTYRNPALGYSIKIPRGLKGLTGDQAGPERGLRISLPSGGEIVVYGEPNSREWKTPAEGTRSELMDEKCASGRREILPARVGRLTGAKGSLVCGDRVVKLVLTIRADRGLVYGLELETIRSHESDDTVIFENFAATFRLIQWQ